MNSHSQNWVSRSGHLRHGVAFLVFVHLFLAVDTRLSALEDIPKNAIEARGVFLRVRDQTELPALERGQLKPAIAEPGQVVADGEVLASLDDSEAALTLQLARIELRIARKKHEESVEIPIAEATLDEAKQLLAQSRLDAEAAKLLASQDIAIRQATRESENSKREFERAATARKNFSPSVADQEFDKLTLARDQDLLRLERARFDQSVEQLRSQSREAMVGQQQSAVTRLEQTLRSVVSEHKTAEIEIERLETQVAIAESRLNRRHLRAPFSGVVVERLHSSGEWVEAGEAVVRLIRLDVLNVEGYVSLDLVSPKSQGLRVLVDCGSSGSPVRLEGKLVFVSPEFDGINRQVLVRAEIQNPNQSLLPGESARMWIIPAQ